MKFSNITILFLYFTLSSAAAMPAETDIIRTREQLTERLKQPSPLDAFSPGARERFLAKLAFGSRGLGSFDPTDLAADLSPAQCREVMAMFWDDADDYVKYYCADDPRNRANAAQRKAGLSEIERRYNRFYLRQDQIETQQGDASRNHAIVAAYAEEMPAVEGENLRTISDSDLDFLLRAAMSATMGSGDSNTGDTTLRLFAEYEQRGPASSTNITRLFNLLLLSRHFDEAAQFAAQHPQVELPTVPTLVDTQTNLPSVWQEDGKGHWVRHGIDLMPLQIIVTAGCHFSADAAEDISTDPVLGPIFAQHARWLSLAIGYEDLRALAEWNRDYPHTPMMPIHKRDEWAIFPNWNMPMFHIVRNGEVIESVTGWPRDPTENREPLIAALKRAGLLAADVE